MTMITRRLTLAAALAAALTGPVAAQTLEGPELYPGEKSLYEAAAKEGIVVSFDTGPTWANWAAQFAAFKKRYPAVEITYNDLGSAATVVALDKARNRPQADTAYYFAASAIDAVKKDVVAPFKPVNFDKLPDVFRDPEGKWFTIHSLTIAFVVNKKLVANPPKSWADLLKPEYANSVALAGDPRASNQAIQAVYAAGISAGGKDAASIGDLGLKFFAELNKKGNFVPVIGKAASFAQGATPILIRWDYNALADRDTLKGNPEVAVVVPKTGVVAGVYVQAISAYAPHPNAAKLWMEYLYSDEGQIGWLKGYCHPIRFNDLAEKGKIPADLMAKLPPAEAYKAAVFPTLDEQAQSKEVITKQWDKVVGANVK